MSARWSTTVTSETPSEECDCGTNASQIDALKLRATVIENDAKADVEDLATLETTVDSLSSSVSANAADIAAIEATLAAVSWSAWSPTVTALTVGNGTMLARYRVDGRTMHFAVQFTLGSTSAVSSNPKIGLPSGWTVFDDGVNQTRVPFPAAAYDSSASTWYSGVAVAGDAANNVFTTRIIFGTTAVTATTPFTWASGDILMLSGSVEVEPV